MEPSSDFSNESFSDESSSPLSRLNLPPKPVLASAFSNPAEPPLLPTASVEEKNALPQEVEKKSCSHPRSSILLAIVAIIASLLALGIQLWTYLKN